MAENSAIEWTDHTFNPWIGCMKVSDGCKHCYAETLMDKRYGKVKWGPQGKRVRTSAVNWHKPLAWNKQARAEGRRYRVFCASLADVLEEKPDQPEMDDWRRELFSLIFHTNNLDWLLLTKRPENAIKMFYDATGTTDIAGFMPNIWIGTSVENQEQADKRIPELLKIPAAVRFLSCEPLLGHVLLDDGINSWLTCTSNSPEYPDDDTVMSDCCESYAVGGAHFHGIDWVIVGGESGPEARPMHPDWAQSIRDQCKAAGVPFFFKQWGEWLPHGQSHSPISTRGGDFHTWSDYPFDWSKRVGKHAAGRMLDGRTWDEFPVMAEEVRP